VFFSVVKDFIGTFIHFAPDADIENGKEKEGQHKKNDQVIKGSKR
jgi:hypothetical protein